MYLLLALYLMIVASLLWGRLFFFRVDRSGTPRATAIAYDAAVGLQILITIYHMVTVTQFTKMVYIPAALFYGASLALFWWAVIVARSLDFAFSSKVGSIVTTGPYGVVRHPFYTSYLMVWATSSLLFNSRILWITLLYLGVFYFLSARKEEEIILESHQSEQYKNYRNRVGMFLPRIQQWKQSRSKH